MGRDGSLSVYITGATTVPGLALLRALVARGHRAAGSAATLAEAHRLRAAGALPVYIDERRADELAAALRLTDATVLIHAAPQAVNCLLPDKAQLDDALDSLTAGTDALLVAAATRDECFLIHCSHAFLYGDTGGASVSEDAELAGAGAFFEAAVAAERALLASDLPACVLRAGLLYGPQDASLDTLRAALLNGSLPPGIAPGLAGWLHLEDLAAAVALAAEQQPAGMVLNVADDRPVTRGAFLERFAGRMGLLLPQRSRLDVLLGRVRPSSVARALPAASFAVSNARIRATLGWAPQYTDIERGLEQILLAWRATPVPA